jgi:hypothetical protein
MKAAIFTACIGAIGGGGTWVYNIGYNNGARDIASVDAFKGKLPTMIDDLDKVSRSLSQATDLVEQNKKLAKEAADALSAKKQIEEAAKKQATALEQKDKQIVDLTALVAKAFPADEIKVSVEAGAAERPIPNLLTIGIGKLYDSFASGYVNDESTTFHPGEPKALKLKDRTCTVTLMKLADPAPFFVACDKK